MALPKFLQNYFWDVDFKNLKLNQYPEFILERILEEGDERAVKWAKRVFSKDDFIKVLTSSRNISSRSANFWALVLGVKPEKILCLKQPLLKKQKKSGPY